MIYCGIDMGTTSTKAVAVDDNGRVIDTVAMAAPVADGAVYWSEHFCQVMDSFAVRGRFHGESVACSVTGQGGSFVLMDERCRPACSMSSWTKLAEGAIVRDLVNVFGEMEYYHLTGWPPHGWLAAARLRQMVERRWIPHEARRVATVPDFVHAQLTGELATDVTSAQITGLADFQGLRWSREVLDWVGIDEAWLPTIASALDVLANDIESPWGELTLVTGSHDQYAAMEAAGLVRDADVILATGTAWVIDGRTSKPVFDDRQFLTHPGRDLLPDCYGLIVTLWQIGAGFERLLKHLGIDRASLADLEATFAEMRVPQGPVRVDLDTGSVDPAEDAAISVRRYMEWAGSVVAHALEICGVGHGLEKIVATGGSMASRFWPQAIADICGLTVEAVDCPQLTAYGAALHARHALLGPAGPHRLPGTATIRIYTPRQPEEYQTWYRRHQRPILEARCD